MSEHQPHSCRKCESNPYPPGTLIHDAEQAWQEWHRANETYDDALVLQPDGSGFGWARPGQLDAARAAYPRIIWTEMSALIDVTDLGDDRIRLWDTQTGQCIDGGPRGGETR